MTRRFSTERLARASARHPWRTIGAWACLQAARAIRARRPETGILVLSQYVRASYALELLSVGTEGICDVQGPRLRPRRAREQRPPRR